MANWQFIIFNGKLMICPCLLPPLHGGPSTYSWLESEPSPDPTWQYLILGIHVPSRITGWLGYSQVCRSVALFPKPNHEYLRCSAGTFCFGIIRISLMETLTCHFPPLNSLCSGGGTLSSAVHSFTLWLSIYCRLEGAG